MPTFFANDDGNSPVGRVVQIKDSHTQGTIRFASIQEKNVAFSTHRSIITRLTVAHQCNFQFLHTIGNEIYVYVFGDRIGQLTLSGLSFAAGCANLEEQDHGFEKVIRWYEETRVAARRDPVTVLVGRTGMSCFLTGLTGDVVDPNSRIMQWTANFTVLPKKG